MPSWNAPKDGNYKVKEAIKILSNGQEDEIIELWAHVWIKGIIAKIPFFMWILAHSR